eukprot:2558017-Rhodomonas_salina.1
MGSTWSSQDASRSRAQRKLLSSSQGKRRRHSLSSPQEAFTRINPGTLWLSKLRGLPTRVPRDFRD